MSKLSNRKSLPTFETDDTAFDRGRNRPVVVTAKPKFAELRLKGVRGSEPVHVPWSAIYMRGLQAQHTK